MEDLLRRGQAAWCAPVRLELWAGVNSDQERRILRHYEKVLPDFPVTADVWREACALGSAARGKGIRIPAFDLLIAACARHHGAGIESADSHFDLKADLAKIGD